MTSTSGAAAIHAAAGRCEWGNPYSHRPSRVPGVIVVPTVEEAIERYRLHLWEEIRTSSPAT